MKIKEKPKKPTRDMAKVKIELWDGANLRDIINDLPTDIPLDRVLVDFEWDYDNTKVFFNYEVLESEQVYLKKLEKYKEKKLEYEKWLSEHVDLVKDHERKKNRRKNIMEEIAKLEKELRGL